MAVGFEDGSIMLYRGDLTRERKNKIKVLKDSNAVITGLAIKSSGRQSYLFASTANSVYLYNISVKDKEFKSSLDNRGCIKKCSIFAESKNDGHFMIGRDDVSKLFILFIKKIIKIINFLRQFIVTLLMAEDLVMR